MTVFQLGSALHPAVARALRRVEQRLAQRGGVPGGGGVAVVAGGGRPGVAAGLPAGPRVVVQGGTGAPPEPWWRAPAGAASVHVLLDASESAWLAGANGPVVVTGLPRPEPGEAGRGVDPGGHDAMARLWTAEEGPLPDDGPGVAWIGGRGGAPLAAALEAWAQRRAVVALPRTARHDMLTLGGVLFAGNSLEAIEATRLLRAARPLCEELAHRGRRSMDDLGDLDAVTDLFAEAVLLASGARG